MADSLKLCDDPELQSLGYRTIHLKRHRYFFLYKIAENAVYIIFYVNFLIAKRTKLRYSNTYSDKQRLTPTAYANPYDRKGGIDELSKTWKNRSDGQ